MPTMISSQNRGKAAQLHNAFSAAGEIAKLAERDGKENVADAVVGVIKDDKGEFMTLHAFEDVYRNLPGQELCDYAPISGLEDFKAAAVKSAFAGHIPAGSKVAVAASPGGTGAIHSAIVNYVEKGDKYLGPDWYWGPYKTLGLEQGCPYETFVMFNEDMTGMNLEAWKAKTLELFEDQDSVLTIFNSPANNPTGYSITVDEWQYIADTYKEICKDPGKKVIVVWDWAYTEYAGEPDETRAFLKCFDDMPENMLLLCAYSMSKAFMIYGMRSGALIACSTSDEVLKEFSGVAAFTNRNTWSNGSRGAQKALAEVYADAETLAAADAERAEVREMLLSRAKMFTGEADEIGLKYIPYGGGFFITVPCDNSAAVIEELHKNEIFVLSASGKGIRISISSCPAKRIHGLAASIKDAIQTVNA